MALTTGINQIFSSTFRSLPQKQLQGATPPSSYESVAPYDTKAGNTFVVYFEAIVPVGFGWASATNYDVLNLCTVGGNAPNFGNTTVNPGYRLRRLAIQSSGNAGGTVPIHIGFATANNLFNVNANTSGYLGGGAGTGTYCAGTTGGAGSTFLQSANMAVTDDVPTGNLFQVVINTPTLNAQDMLILVPTTAGAVATTTLVTLKGRLEYFLTGPVGY